MKAMRFNTSIGWRVDKARMCILSYLSLILSSTCPAVDHVLRFLLLPASSLILASWPHLLKDVILSARSRIQNPRGSEVENKGRCQVIHSHWFSIQQVMQMLTIE
ncbi:hypothetical protein GYMLUDRAFT_959518 [Collybiopsis luxurians FD-317 M1]|nr:hypothetical protein GYMLUDRAFT_959518 [Collybiopsis luxurians FD-317 M1]